MAARMRKTCEREINNLVDLKEVEEGLEGVRPDQRDVRRKKRVALEALTEWTEQVKVLEGKLSRRKKRVDFLTNEIYQLVGLYSVFVSVVFSAVVSERVHCQHIWSPILLCLLPCFIIAHIINRKLENIHRIQGEISNDEISRRANLRNLSVLRLKGYERFDLSEDVQEPSLKNTEDPNRQTSQSSDGQTGETLSITKRGVGNILLFLSAVIVGSLFHILCFTKTLGACEYLADFAPGDLRILPS